MRKRIMITLTRRLARRLLRVLRATLSLSLRGETLPLADGLRSSAVSVRKNSDAP
jgi:hypothetical protein